MRILIYCCKFLLALMINFLLCIQQRCERALFPNKNYKRVPLIPATLFVDTLLCLIVWGVKLQILRKKTHLFYLIIIREWPKNNPGIFSSTFLLLVNGSKNLILNGAFKLNLVFACFSKKVGKTFS